MKNFKSLIIGLFLICFLLFSFPIFSDQSEIISKEHLKFYKSGQVIRIAKILNFGNLRGKRLVSVTVHYSMVKSKLSGEFVISGRSFGINPLKQGLKEEATHVFNIAVPSEMGFYFHGKRGQIQVRSVSALIKPVIPVLADPIRKKKRVKKFYKYAKLKRILPKERSLDLINPIGGDSILYGSQIEILWQMRGMSRRVTGELWRGNRRIELIFDRLRGTEGKYYWRASGREVIPGGNYWIKIRTIDNQFSAESGRFTIFQELTKLKVSRYIDLKKRPGFHTPRVADPVSLNIIEPDRNTSWEIFRTYPIRWNSRGLGSNEKIGIALKKRNSAIAKIIAIQNNTGIFNYTVPYPVGLFGDDVKVIITPLKYRRVEIASKRFTINKPDVDLVCSSPRIELVRKRKKRKWWHRVGPLFSLGFVTYKVADAVDALLFKETVLHVSYDVFNNGSANLRNVELACAIITRNGYPQYEFPVKLIPMMINGRFYPVEFSVHMKNTHLKKGDYLIEMWLDPMKDQNESERLRKNNRIAVDFNVKTVR